MSQLIGYVSDQRYVALGDVLVEIVGPDGSREVRSRASGSVYAELPAGKYEVTLSKAGYGSKRVELDYQPGADPHQFRLLSDEVLGYMWPKWVRAGEEAELRVTSPEDCVAELWRYGWEKKLVRGLGVFGEHGPRANVQITPDGDYTQTGARFNTVGYLGRARKKFVEAPERSGLYYIHVKTESGGFFSFPWVVAPAKPQAKLAVLASNITWNAYNNFGGRSNYILAGGLTERPVVSARQDLKRYNDPDHVFYDREDYPPLSFDRPEPMNFIAEDDAITDAIRGRNACHLAPAEWRLLGWLEREGFDYDLYAETQLHFGQLPLDEYEVLMLSTHPEYWSWEMYTKVKEWVFQRGGKLAYLGGNGLNCEVEFLDERTMAVLNTDTRSYPEDKYESRLHARRESEASLLGVVYTEAGAMTGAPYKVVDADHWALEGTKLEKGELFGEKSLHVRCPGGASGHETDKVSPSSADNAHLIAKGTNPEDGGAHMIHFTNDSGGEVFSAGSIAWTSSVAVDGHVSKVTHNVLKRFLGE